MDEREHPVSMLICGKEKHVSNHDGTGTVHVCGEQTHHADHVCRTCGFEWEAH